MRVSLKHDDLGRLISEARTGVDPYDLAYEYDPGGNRNKKTDALNQTRVDYEYDYAPWPADPPTEYDSANNRLMRSETYDTSGPGDALMSTTYYRYNVQGNVTRVVTEPADPGAGPQFTATRLIYAKNGSTVTYVMGETWDEGETCPENYTITYGREFRYDGPRARYLSRELDTTALLSGSFVPVSDTWTDYDGDTSYGDFTIDGITVTDGMWYEPGIARSAGAQDRSTAAYYHADLIGTTRDVSVAGAGTGPATYTAFGEQVSGTTHRYGYVGAHGYQTDDTGAFPYQHVGARYYDPATGRFLQRDPIGIHGGANVYAYAKNAATRNIDPSGSDPCPCCGHDPDNDVSVSVGPISFPLDMMNRAVDRAAACFRRWYYHGWWDRNVNQPIDDFVDWVTEPDLPEPEPEPLPDPPDLETLKTLPHVG